MSKGSDLGLLNLLKNKGNGADALRALAAKAPSHEPAADAVPAADAKLAEVLDRITQLTTADVRRGEAPPTGQTTAAVVNARSEERRVGKGCGSGAST